MDKSPVLYALHNKYRHIKGELASLDNQCEKLRADMTHLSVSNPNGHPDDT